VAERGRLEALKVRDGQYVEVGQVIAVFTNLEAENKLAEATTDHDVSQAERMALEPDLGEDRQGDPRQHNKLPQDYLAAHDQELKSEDEMKIYKAMLERLVLKAPVSGVVMGLPQKDEIGKTFEKELESPFCSVGDPTQLRALVPLGPADYRLLKEDRDAAQATGGDLAVDIRVRGRGAAIFPGQVAELPAQEAKEVPLSLTTQAGGPLAVRQGQRPHTFTPQSQCYLVAVDFQETDKAIRPGTMCQVKVHCQWHSAAWWVWRTLSKTFDLGLL
jgi:putative peptide zinc metalloprotease protein